VDYVSYGISYYIASTKQKASPEIPYNINAVADPSYVVYFGDARFLQLRPTKGCWKKDWNPVHPEQGANYVMADGHVEFFTGKNPGLYDKVPGWKQDRKRWKNWKKL
jgi:prepilin-type processing-associated H-X9-DG protein